MFNVLADSFGTKRSNDIISTLDVGLQSTYANMFKLRSGCLSLATGKKKTTNAEGTSTD